uniref:RRM domain-containing protein n=1 Tax=Oryza punctata TaxID=4537 RepID=A0A0E0LH06_ORYPU
MSNTNETTSSSTPSDDALDTAAKAVGDAVRFAFWMPPTAKMDPRTTSLAHGLADLAASTASAAARDALSRIFAKLLAPSSSGDAAATEQPPTAAIARAPAWAPLLQFAATQQIIPISARLFVFGVSKKHTTEPDLRRHFKRYGYVADIWLRRRGGYAFVQFMIPSHAALALADKNQVVNGRKIYIGIAQPKLPAGRPMAKYLCQRVCPVDNKLVRIGDRVLSTLGPLPGNYEASDYITNLRRYGVIQGNMLTFDSVVDYISEDCQRCCVSFVVNKSDANKPVRGNNISSTTPSVGDDATAKFCRYCLQAVTPGDSSNFDELIHNDSSLIYQESFLHFTYGLKIANKWYPLGAFVGDMSSAEAEELENFYRPLW